MKKLRFIKMAGSGNDFILAETPRKGVNVKKLARQVCERTTGIGADGLILLGTSKKADYKMRIINADGSEAEMCGNGARCLAAYIVREKKPRKKIFTVETLAGILEAEAKGETARVRLSDPRDYRPNQKIKLDGRTLNVHYIDTGVPHVILYVQDLAQTDIAGIGRKIRFHDAFLPRGANVNFVEYDSEELVECRTYERGVEDETKACGTGSVAAAIVSYLQLYPHAVDKNKAKMKVKTKSGEILLVSFDIHKDTITNVCLKGSAKFIAKGEYYV